MAAGFGGAAWAATDPAQALLSRAIVRAGGARALSAARVLAWDGEAVVHVGQRALNIGVSTEVRPFDHARSETWLASDGRAHPRTLLIDGDQGWLLNGAERTPMPQTQLRHEREQFALYGLMRLVSLRDAGVLLQHVRADAAGREGLRAAHPRAPVTEFRFDPDGRLATAANTVDGPDGGPMIGQAMVFEGEIRGGGLRWPRTMRIAQGGAPYFDLTLTAFRPGATLSKA